MLPHFLYLKKTYKLLLLILLYYIIIKKKITGGVGVGFSFSSVVFLVDHDTFEFGEEFVELGSA